MKMTRTLPGLVACTCLSTLAAASPVTWTLSNLTFGHGGTASGSFVYDATTNTFSSIDVTTTDGSVRSGETYSFPSTVGNASAADFIDIDLPVGVGTTMRLDMYLNTSMTDAGGTLNVLSAQEFTCISAGCSFSTGTEPGLDLRLGAGEITLLTVPEPASLALVGIGLAAAARFRRRVQ